nr:zinc finger, CCHC-type [Tanacetum cinerariifolium]
MNGKLRFVTHGLHRGTRAHIVLRYMPLEEFWFLKSAISTMAKLRLPFRVVLPYNTFDPPNLSCYHVMAAGYRYVKVLEFFDCPSPRQGVEDLRELLHKDKQPEKKTNTDCLVKEQEKEYQTGWKIKTGNVLDFCNQSLVYQRIIIWKNGKWSCIYAVGSQEYQMVCTRPDIALTDVGMLDGFDRGLQTYVQVFVDFDYAMGRSITRYGFMILGCAGSLKANLQHIEALSTTKAEYIALTEAVKEAIWLKGLLEELGVELNRVAVNYDNQGAIHLS